MAQLDSAVTSTVMVMDMTKTTDLSIDRSIYVMPMFVTFPVSDLDTAQSLYSTAGFVTLATIPDKNGTPALIHLRREKYQDILLTPIPPQQSALPASASFAAGGVDLPTVADHLRKAGAKVIGPIDTSWFTSDLTFSDPDGNTVTLTSPRKHDQQYAQQWVNEHITGDFQSMSDTAIV